MSTEKKFITLDVSGMSCGSCVRHVQRALQEVDGVSSVDVQLRTGKVEVCYVGEQPSEEAMIEALREAGYDAATTRPAIAASA